MSLIQDRRNLHQIPELDRALPETMAYLRQVLTPLGCKLSAPSPGSLAAFFHFGQADTLAFRADCDALPIQEATNHPFASRHPGRMHACGHDGHMAIALELARRVSQKSFLPHNILILFQPAEETTGGAKAICDSGILAQHRVKAIFGLHLWPELERGTLFTRPGAMMSRSCELTVDIFGRSAHIGRSWEGIDALSAGVAFYTQARALEQSLPPSIPRVLNFGHMVSGSARNALSNHTHLEGSLRVFDDETFHQLSQGLERIARNIEQTQQCPVRLHLSPGYPPVRNPETLVAQVQALLPLQHLPQSTMTTEDFSFYQQAVPGLFVFLGLGNTPPLHSPIFDFDESVLFRGADYFTQLAEEFP